MCVSLKLEETGFVPEVYWPLPQCEILRGTNRGGGKTRPVWLSHRLGPDNR